MFNHLPVHAATRIKDPFDPNSMAGDSLTDRFVSSHTPTLRALKAAREADRAASGAKPPMLLVGVGRTPLRTNLAELHHVAAEIDAVARLFPTSEPLRDEDALRETVLRRLRAGGWFHFAGHGEQNPEEPDGLLYLWDHATSDSLRIRDITGLRLDKAELAFLSACQTHLAPRAHSDEPVSLTGALQLAGFRHHRRTVAAEQPPVPARHHQLLRETAGKLRRPRAGGPRADSPRRGTRPVRSGAGASQRTPRSRAGVGGVRAPRPVTKRRGGCSARPRHCCEQPPLALVPSNDHLAFLVAVGQCHGVQYQSPSVTPLMQAR